MQYVRELAAFVEDHWASAGRSIGAFTEVAQRAFVALPPPDALGFRALLEHVVEIEGLARQANLEGTFGEPPLTLFWAEGFYIDAYIWRTATTSIHQHAFAGAFCVIDGPSIQAQYEFDLQERIDARLALGTLRLKRLRRLTRGEVHPIEPGAGFIHSISHLAHPSVTLCIRTPDLPSFAPQLDYAPPSLAIDPFALTPTLRRQLQMLTAAFGVSRALAIEAAARLVERLDPVGAYRLMITTLTSKGFDDAAPVLDALRRTHGAVGDEIERAFREEARRVQLRTLRKYTLNEEHRTLLACLLALDGRAAILAAIESFSPSALGGPTSRRVVRWLAEIEANAPVGSVPWGVPLGVIELACLEQLLLGLDAGSAERAVLLESSQAGEPLDANEVRTACFVLPHVPALAPLLANSSRLGDDQTNVLSQ